ncbi:MAG TPA: bifunctional diguanylate cyclase/phosphodiesterase [Mycobacteriales bacterium]|nr:bifunctional diguanylate cyclase/phosphodiesterase [Mycobacteriales bacterium]
MAQPLVAHSRVARAFMPATPQARLRLLVTVVGVAGAGCLLYAVGAAGDVAGAVPIRKLLVVSALFCLGELAVLSIRFRGERHAVTWTDAAVVFGLAIVPRPWLAIAAAAAVLLAHALRRRAPEKVVFNAASMAVATTVGLLAMHVYGDPVRLTGLTRTAALATGVVCCFALNTFAVTAAIAFSQDTRIRDVLRGRLPLDLLVFFAGATLALVVVNLQWNRTSLTAVSVFVALLYVAYRAYLTAEQDRDAWQGLEEASKELVGLRGAELADVVIKHAVALLKAPAVDLYITRDDARVDCFSGDETSRTHDIVDASVLADLEPGASPEGIAHWAQSGEALPFTWTVPLTTAGIVGALRFRFQGGVQPTARGRQLLQAFAATVALNFDNAKLFDDIEMAARRNEYDATHDALTGMPNRSLLLRHADRVLDGSEGRSALLLLDLDHFKAVNDTLGHATGDRLLITIARRLASVARAGDLIARLGGDEFALFATELESIEAADELARQVIDAVEQPVILDGLRVSVGASVGISSCPGDAEGIGEMLAHADVALYQAKTVRGSHRHYRPERDESSLSRLAVAAELRSALRRGELVLHYQPQYRLGDGRIAGAEALVRWQHPSRGLLPPAEFITVAEDSGLAHEFTKHVLSLAVSEAAQWQRPGRPVHVAVNLSARNLLDPDLPSAVSEVLARHSLDASLLVLEITETTMIAELETVEETLDALRNIGVQISIDDFGTGYSSLTFLTRNAVHELKVDRDFVLRLRSSSPDAAIVRATIDLGHSLGARIVAEGVEDRETLAHLVELGCDNAQGYLLARPLTSTAMRARIAAPATIDLVGSVALSG